MNNDCICKTCECFVKVDNVVSDSCKDIIGYCCIGGTLRNIGKNERVTGCCLYEPCRSKGSDNMKIENSCALCNNSAYSPKTGYVCSMGAPCAENIGNCLLFDPDYGKVAEDEKLRFGKSEIVYDEKTHSYVKKDKVKDRKVGLSDFDSYFDTFHAINDDRSEEELAEHYDSIDDMFKKNVEKVEKIIAEHADRELNSQIKSCEKPSLGVEPYYIIYADRVNALCDAIKRVDWSKDDDAKKADRYLFELATLINLIREVRTYE